MNTDPACADSAQEMTPDRSGHSEPAALSGTMARVLVAIPLIAFAVFVVSFGGWVFSITAACFAVLALHELYVLLHDYRPLVLAGFIGSVAMILAATRYGPDQILMVLMLSLLLVFLLAIIRRERRQVTASMAVTMFGVVWIGLAISHGVMLRELAHGGGLVIGVIASTSIGDSGAYFGGKLYGRHPLAKRISPNKTWEGVVAGTLASIATFWFVGIYQDWITGWESVILGVCVAVAAPLGDLFESLVKRDADIKDSGSFFGAHGGVLDRIDALLFTFVVIFYVAKDMHFG